MAKNEKPYDVGYGKPPKSGRFTKGMSGNPNGRLKGHKNFASIVAEECRKPVRVNGPNGARTVTKLEAVIMQLGNKAAQGDLRAAREFLFLVERCEEAMNSASAPQKLHELDQRVMQSLLRRLRAVPTEETLASQPTSGKDSE